MEILISKDWKNSGDIPSIRLFPTISYRFRGRKIREIGKSWKRTKGGGKCGGVADNRTTNRNGAFVSMKSGLTLCWIEWRERERGLGSWQMAVESKTKEGWNVGLHRSYASFHLAPTENFHPCLAFYFACFIPAFLLLFFHPFRAITNRNSSSRA